MPVQNATITAGDYNTVQSRINTIMGTDYGQSLLSGQVSVGQTITDDQLDNLRTDITKAYTHQQGTGPTITNVDVGDTILAAHLNQYATVMTTVESNLYSIGSGQFSIESGTSSSRTSPWNGTLEHRVLVSFGSDIAKTQFFKAGGEIRFTASQSGGSSSINVDWRNMLANMGTIKMNYTNTTSTGSGSGTSIGQQDLTGSYQQIFQKSGSGVYAANDYIISALSQTGAILFRIYLQDDKGGNPDENVTGTTTSNVQHLRASGSNVSLSAPTYTNQSTL
tara:strand:- start:26986 stop:27822 length:837 start_codon:yes stop_codon:yes gene_type:complete